MNQPTDVAGFLGRVGILQVLSPLVLQEVAEGLQALQTPPGVVIIEEGAPADGLYFIEQGTVVVETGGHAVARLGPGEFFGEIAVLGGTLRQATVRAETTVRTHHMQPQTFLELSGRFPALGEAAARAARLRGVALQQQEHGPERVNVAALLETQSTLTIGRHPDNDLVLDSLVVSARHARLRREGQVTTLEDLSSSNGTYVNGVQVLGTELKDGDVIWLADTRLVYDRRGLSRVMEPVGIRIDAVGLRKEVKGAINLLADISLSILPGEFVAIVGGSGTGKSTLMDALSGVRPATAGRVLYNGEDFYPRRALYTHQLGYVPQDDIIHRDLPTRVTLDYAARLRLPPDVSASERAEVVGSALDQLGLGEQADVDVSRLSGGQRKRASIGVELLTRPRVFFLDEPTSGLDPATDAAMMRLLRDLTDSGSTVVLTTHATKNVELCDKVVFLAKGGTLAFVGSPRRALDYFGTEAFDEIYTLLEQGTAQEWGQRFASSDDHRTVVADQIAMPPSPPGQVVEAPRGQRGFGLRLRQFVTLSRRSIELYLRNPGRTIPLFVQPVVFTLLLLALFRPGVFDSDNDVLTAPTQLLFIFTFTVFLFGLLWGIQEIVSEFSIFRRERLVNLGVLPYLMSKTTFLVPVTMFGITVMIVLLRLFDRLPTGGFAAIQLPLWFTLFLMGLVGLSLALMSSAIAQTSQAATDSLSIWIMPQVLFAGAIFPVPEMALPGRVIALFVPLRWGFEAVGHVIDLNAFYAASPSPIAQSLLLQYETSFSRDVVQNWAVLALFIIVPMTVATLVLRRRTTV